MARTVEPLLGPAASDHGRPLRLRWASDVWVEATSRDTVSSALLSAGIVATSRSLKLRRHRGPYCLRGDCGTCLVRIDGRPNQRACMTAVADGMQVEPQNLLTPSGPDPTALADKVFADGMDHHHFMVRPRFMNQIMQGVARNLAGLGTLPSSEPERPARHEHRAVDILVVGGGRAGRALSRALHAGGRSCEVVDRLSVAGLDAAADVHHPATGVFGIYPAEDRVAAMTRGSPEVLRTFTPRHLVLATGATEPLLAFENNDLPGVVAAEGLCRMLRRSGRRPAGDVIVVGDGPDAEAAARTLNARRVDLQDVVAARGTTHVTGLEVRGATLACRMVAVAPAPAPATDLARQAGADVHFTGLGFAVVRDPSGAVNVSGRPGAWQLWATGEVAGIRPEHAAADGRHVAASILQRRDGKGER